MPESKTPESMPETKTTKEKEEDEVYCWTKLYTVLSFAIVIIVIGVPLWWKTTETYRVNLPFSQIEELPFYQVFSTNVSIIVPSHLKKNAPNIARLFNEVSLTEGTLNKIHYNVEFPSTWESQQLQESRSFSEFSQSLLETGRISESGRILVFIVSQDSLSFPFDKKLFVSRHRIVFARESSDIVMLVRDVKEVVEDIIVRKTDLDAALVNVISSQKIKPDKATLWTMQTTPAYDVTFTLIIPDPSEMRAHWSIEEGVEKYLQPMLDKLKPIVNFNVQSQVLYYLSLGINPRLDSTNKWSFLPFEQLPHTINPLEAKLGSHVSVNPSFNFLIYLPKKSESPLYIYDETGKPSKTNAFSSPRWGGIYIYNAPPASEKDSSPTRLVEIDVKKVMEVFISELRIFLGLTSLVSMEQIEYENSDSSCLSDWEVDYLLHKRTIENLATSVNTLKSLSGLLGEIGNIVINDEVGGYVKNAVEAIKESQLHLGQSHLEEAFAFSKEAFISSENAFFDSSMLALLYFPDDQKYAVYVPLFLPVSVPVILSLFQVFKTWRLRRSKSKTD